MGRSRSPSRASIAVYRADRNWLRHVEQYAVPRQIKPRNLELSICIRQSNLSIVFIFDGCKEKYCYRVVSVGQLGSTTAHANHFVVVVVIVFLFLSREV